MGVTGELLAAENPQGDPRLELRLTPDGRHVLAALQDFEPRLPWWLYGWTQAIVHEVGLFIAGISIAGGLIAFGKEKALGKTRAS